MLKHEFVEKMQMAALSKATEKKSVEQLVKEVEVSVSTLGKVLQRWESGQCWDDLIVDCVNTDGENIRVLLGDPDLNTCCNTFDGHQPDCEVSNG